jgi:oxygen-dependent protoporphyrinogen oxidase
MAKRIVVIGGGISGLAAAYRVTELDPSAEVVLLEATDRVGGLVRTEVHGDYVIERGAESIITDKPWALALARRLGLEGEIVSTRPENRGAYVVAHGRLERIPEGFSLLAPVEILPFLKSRILSPAAKARAALDLVLPRGHADDESLAAFVRRRFGEELFDRLAQPLVSGIYGADAARLSLGATMPRFIEMERTSRSVSYALWQKQRKSGGQAASGARYGLFISFRRGNQTLVDALDRALGDRVRRSRRVTSIAPRKKGGVKVHLEKGAAIPCDAVIVALPAHAAARLLAPVDEELGSLLRAIRYGSAATTAFVFDRAQISHPLDAYGFVVPVVEHRAVLASTWLSRKWPGRAPEGKELVRVFLGGARREDVARWSDEELVSASLRELEHLIGLRGGPELVRIDRYLDAMPHYLVGHADLVAHIERRVAGLAGIELAGNAYRGVGIPDSVRSGELAAQVVLG